jgi:hypothetical protein
VLLGECKVNVSELQVKLLEKVEELTLYTLDQHRRIRQQSQTIEQLTRTVEALRQRLETLENAPTSKLQG